MAYLQQDVLSHTANPRRDEHFGLNANQAITVNIVTRPNRVTELRVFTYPRAAQQCCGLTEMH